MMKSIANRAAFLVLLTAVLVFVAASPLKADTIFTNFGSPGQTYESSAYLLSPGFSLASPFVPSETATLTDAMLALSQFIGPVSPPTVYVESDSGGEPGTIIDTLTTAGTLGSTPSILTYTCAICSQLVGGTEYFLVAEATGAVGWNGSNSDTGTYFSSFTSPTGPWVAVTPTDTTLPAYEVDGTPASAPEPSTLPMLAIGLFVVAGVIKRNAKKSRQSKVT
jgi:hypothetical protein